MGIRLRILAFSGPLMAWALLACASGCGDGSAPAEASAALRSGAQHARAGEPERAAADLRRAIELDPRRAEAHFKLGMLLVYLSDVVVGTPTRDYPLLEEASTALQRASELEPENAEYAYRAGDAEALLGRSAEALRLLRRALELEPNHGRAAKRLGLVYADTGETVLAAKWLQKATQVLPGDADAWFRYGVQLESDEALARARQAYERAVEIDWTVPRFHSKLAAVLERMGESEGAEAEARESVRWDEFGRELRERLDASEANPGDAGARIAVGELLRSAGRTENGLAWMRRALALDPSNGRARLAVADTLAELGKGSEAAKHYRAILEAEPEDEAARAGLERVTDGGRR